jgi:phosphatidylglycerol---prolipoprotein diacylglyceryl transferase
MYPTISDLLRDLFGINLPLPIQTFGFFVAISFLLAAYFLQKELKRKEQQGLLQPVQKKILTGVPPKISDIIVGSIIAFFFGYKVVEIFINYLDFVDDPAAMIFSREGNFFGGLVGGILYGGIYFYINHNKIQKIKGKKPQWVDVVIHPYEQVGNLTLAAAVGGLLGAKIFHNLENLDAFSADPWGELFSFSGLTMYGGLIIGAVAVLWYARKINIPALHQVDATAPSLMLAYGVGRIGCHLAGDGDWGIPNTNPKPSFLPDWLWSYTYPHNVIEAGIPIPGCVGKHCTVLPVGVYPTPLYEAIVCILLFVFLWSIRKKFSSPGVLFSVYLLLNGIERFAIEAIRVNTHYHIGNFSFTQAQLISVILIILGITGIFYFRKKKVAAS